MVDVTIKTLHHFPYDANLVSLFTIWNTSQDPLADKGARDNHLARPSLIEVTFEDICSKWGRRLNIARQMGRHLGRSRGPTVV
ncbi:unnamed protein product [Nezara viridula]|uniref:Uncharacterized protein n=1 Tax=Nezara viridula TaxID=85310 RepID=A0A9P0EA14_NEZVI|nr:unnamed protein product [Nezara viridula]